ncbi:MAG: hypothetical protein HDR04_13480 [Lachnospiraceae bacterium]|nr:hypothetical protein [Lachnospiraceae bacterium]
MNKFELFLIAIGSVDVFFLIGFVLIIFWIRRISRSLSDLQQKSKLDGAIIGTSDDSSKCEKEDSAIRNDTLLSHDNSENYDGVSFWNEEKPQIVIKAKSIYEPIQLDAPFPISGVINREIEGDIAGYLIFNDYAIEKLKSALDWGKLTSRNQVEQGGILLGAISFYKDEIYCFVDDILLAKTKGMPAFVEFTKEMWRDMQNELGILNEKRNQDRKLVILGWFHTHPNNLSVFMSGMDMETQRLNFPLNWQVSLVMNPHKNVLRVFFGKEADEGVVVFPK